MDNLFEIREDIKYRSEFERKLNDEFAIVLFYFTVEKLLVFRKQYEDYKLNKSSDRFMTGPLKDCRINRDPRVKYASYDSFEDYLDGIIYKSMIPAQHQLVDVPHINASLSRIIKCLSNWDEIVELHKSVKTKIKLSKDSNLALVGGEPSVITLNKLLSEKELEEVESFKDKDIPLPKVSLFPIKKFREYHHSDAKDFVTAIVFLIILAVLGIVGICMQSQPYTWIGAALLGVVIAIVVGVTIFNIGVVWSHGKSSNRKWLPFSIALLCGAALFGTTYEPDYDDAERTPVQGFYSPSPVISDSDERTVYTTEYGECYHSTQACPSLTQSKYLYTTTQGEAKKRYRPCSRCN